MEHPQIPAPSPEDGAKHAVEIATAAATMSPLLGRQMSQDEFLALYRNSMRQRHEQQRQQEQQQQPAQAQAAPNAQAPPAMQNNNNNNNNNNAAPRNQRFAFLNDFRWASRALWTMMKIAMVCAVFAHGDMQQFFWLFGILCGFKLIGFVSQFVRLDLNLNVNGPGGAAAANANGNRAVAARPPTRFKKFGYMVFMLATSFVVSLFPSWRLEAFHEEIRRDPWLGEQPKPTPAPAAAPAAPAAAAPQAGAAPPDAPAAQNDAPQPAEGQ